ncbi:hypothetical protein L9F63_003854, partial [Diploptera punctata]
FSDTTENKISDFIFGNISNFNFTPYFANHLCLFYNSSIPNRSEYTDTIHLLDYVFFVYFKVLYSTGINRWPSKSKLCVPSADQLQNNAVICNIHFSLLLYLFIPLKMFYCYLSLHSFSNYSWIWNTSSFMPACNCLSLPLFSVEFFGRLYQIPLLSARQAARFQVHWFPSGCSRFVLCK